jgi:3-oxoacyl-[acyl-carrier protein] reductase
MTGAAGPLHGRVALVTGASGGIGAAIARIFSEAGADVVLGYSRDGTSAKSLAREIIYQGRAAITVGADLARPEGAEELVRQACAEMGKVDILAASAGTLRVRSMEQTSAQDWDEALAVNLSSAFYCTQAVLPGMRQRSWGRLVYVSSIAALVGGWAGPAYAAAKAGLLGLAHYVAGATAAEGITANTITPALIDTPMLPSDTAERERLRTLIPTGRFGRPSEVAELALAIVTNAYLTNQTIELDGGRHPR